MRKIFVAMTLVSVLTVYVQAQANNRRDGNWWNQQTVAGKYDYVTGFFDGMDLGHQFSFWGLIDDPKDDNHQSTYLSETMDSYSKFGKKFLNEVTNSQVADGLDEFYKDYRNRSVRLKDGVWGVGCG